MSFVQAKQPEGGLFLSPKQEAIDLLYLDLATRVGQESHAIRRKVGAVIAKGNSILDYGWNGMPKGAGNSCETENEEGELVTRPEVIHAEENALLKIASKGGVGVEGAAIYCDYAPCGRCAARLATAGIKKVVFRDLPRKDFSGLVFLLQSPDVHVYREVDRRVQYVSPALLLSWLPEDGSQKEVEDQLMEIFQIEKRDMLFYVQMVKDLPRDRVRYVEANGRTVNKDARVTDILLSEDPLQSTFKTPPFNLPGEETMPYPLPIHTALQSEAPSGVFPVPAGHEPNPTADTYRTADQVSKDLELVRREPQSNLTYTVTPPAGMTMRDSEVFDYAGPALKIQAGMHHLDESLPNRQKLRSEEAFRAILEGVTELRVWMQAQGFNV